MVPERISDNEESDVLVISVVEDFISLRLDHFPVGDEDILAEERLQPLLGDMQDRRIVFKVHSSALFDGVEAAYCDVGFVCEAEADQVQHCRRKRGGVHSLDRRLP